MRKELKAYLHRYDLDTFIGYVRSEGINYKVNLKSIPEKTIKSLFVRDSPALYFGEYKNKTLFVDKIEEVK